jgi:hypothetical protein
MPYKEDTAKAYSFDELAKGLANRSLSRGDALKWVGAAIVGGLLGSIPGVAWAQVEAPCTEWCKATFRKKQARDECIASAALKDGPCWTCGPASTLPDPPDVCNAGTGQAVCCPETQPRCVDRECRAFTRTEFTTCASVDCSSGLAIDEVCAPLCASHGGVWGTACISDDPACVGQSGPNRVTCVCNEENFL